MKALVLPLLVALCLFVSACAEPISKGALEEKYAGSPSAFVEVNGHRTHYREEGLGEVVVLIHGTASSLHTWDAWTEKLQRDFRVVRMDLPGFGLTGPNQTGSYEVSDDVQFLSAFLKALDIEVAHFAGSSLGGRIAWQCALEHPTQVQTLTLMNSLGYPQETWPPPIEMAQWPVVDKIMESFSPRFMYEIGLKEVYFDENVVTDQLVDRYFELSRYPGNLEAFPKRVKARLDKDSSLISGLNVPTLIMWGKEDLYFPVERAHRFKEDVKGASLVVYENVGHLPMEELPEVSVDDFIMFVARERESAM